MLTHVEMGSLRVSKLQNPNLVPDSDLTLPPLLQDPLEKEIVTHSSTLAWEIRGWRRLADYSPWGGKSQTQLSDFTFTFPSLRLF